MTTLPHYNRLLKKKDKAYYLRCTHIPVEFDDEDDLDSLFKAHAEYEKVFLEDGGMERQDIPGKTFLDLKIKICQEMLKKCHFCENRCEVDRTDESKKAGKCGLKTKSYISSSFLHMGEESPLVPSGTIFFSGCTLNCVFCQNWDIAEAGKTISLNERERTSPEELAKIASSLVDRGARNINWVGGDPTPNIHNIIASLKEFDKNICVLWNSNMYSTPEAIRLLRETMDLWLPDFKYGNNDCALKLSRISGYWDILKRNLLMVYNWGSRDILIRHLVMPGHIECCTVPIMKWIGENIPGSVVNIMAQYHPDHLVLRRQDEFREITRRVTSAEMESARDAAKKYGVNVLRR